MLDDTKGHKGEDYSQTSPKKLVKQTHICDSDSVFESEKPEMTSERIAAEATDPFKSVGFA